MNRIPLVLLLLLACSGPEDQIQPSVETDSFEAESQSVEAPSEKGPEASVPTPTPEAAPPIEGPQFQMKAGDAAAGGWQTQSEESPADLAEAQPLSDAERARYSQVATELVRAINDENREAYRALHTDEAWESAIPWWRDMFPLQISRFGRIAKAYAPVRGMIRFGGMGFQGGEGEMATVVVRFEEPTGGALSFEIDDANKITKTSVFIKEELAHYSPEGKDAELIYELK